MNPLRTLIDAFEQERTRWTYWIPVALAMGIVGYFTLPDEPPLWIIAAPLPIGLTAWLCRDRFWALSLFLFTLTLIALGFSASTLETLIDARPMLEKPLRSKTVSGRVAAVDIMPDGLRLTLLHPRIDTLPPQKTPEKIRIKFNDLVFDEAPQTGSDVSFKAFLNPSSEAAAPGAADFRRLAFHKGLGGIGWSHDTIKIQNPAPTDNSESERFALMLERARKTLARHVYARLPNDVAAITAARMNGEQTGITSPVMDAMRTSGLIHLLATSGANVTIMGLLIYFPLRALMALWPWLALNFPIKKWAAVGAIVSALSFTFLVGSQAATVRSLLMVALAMTAIILDRHTNPLRLVMMSAFLGMLLAPSATIGASFQMSFASVFCLIAAAPLLTQKHPHAEIGWLPEWGSGLFHNLKTIILASIIATAATTPFSVYHFQTFNVYGFLSNTLAIPLTSFWVMPFTVMAYLTVPLGWDGFFIDMAGLGNALTIMIAKTVSSWPCAVFHLPAMPDYVLILFVGGGLWLCLWRQKWRYFGILPIVIGMLYPLYTRQPDFFVSPTGKTWAVRLEDGRLATSNKGREKFAIQQWQQRLGNVTAIRANFLPQDHKELTCDTQGCLYKKGTITVAMPSKKKYIPQACEKATVVIAPYVIKNCAAHTIIDRHALKERGAHTLTFKKNKIVIETTRTHRGGRPWSFGFNYSKPN